MAMQPWSPRRAEALPWAQLMAMLPNRDHAAQASLLQCGQSFGASSAVRLTVRTGAAEYEIMQHSAGSPAASPRRQASPSKSALKAQRRVHFAAEPEVQQFTADGESSDAEQGITLPTDADASANAAQGAQLPRQSPPQQHYFATPPAPAPSYSSWYGCSTAAGTGYQWPHQQQQPQRTQQQEQGQQARWTAGSFGSSQPATQTAHGRPQQTTQPQHQEQQYGLAPSGVAAAEGSVQSCGSTPSRHPVSVERGGDAGSPHGAFPDHQHVKVHTNSVSITVSSPRVQLASGNAGEEKLASKSWQAQPEVQQRKQPESPVAMMQVAAAATQTDVAAEPHWFPRSVRAANAQQQQPSHPTVPPPAWVACQPSLAECCRGSDQKRQEQAAADSHGDARCWCRPQMQGSGNHITQQQPTCTGRPLGVSAADALPARLAAQQLGSLAGMSRQVQEAILHSQRLCERQASVVEQAVLARAFYVSLQPMPQLMAL